MGMAKNTKPHPGKILKQYIEDAGITVTEAADRLQIYRPNLSSILSGRRGISAGMAHRIAAATDTEPMFWMKRQAEYELERAYSVKITRNVKSILPEPRPFISSCQCDCPMCE